MIHRITMKSNPRLFLVLGLIILLILGGLAAFLFIGLVLGGLILAVLSFLAYSLYKFLRDVLKSNVNTYDDGLTFTLSTGKKERFNWEKITHGGKCADSRGKPSLFLYQEDEDRFIVVSSEFSDFPELEKTFRENITVPFEECSLGEGETVQEHIKKLALPD